MKTQSLAKVTIAEALEWFVAKDAITRDASGSLAPLCAAAGRELSHPVELPPKSALPPRPKVYATAEEWDAHKAAIASRRDVEITIPIKVGLYTVGYFE